MAKLDNIAETTTSFKKADAFINLTLVTKAGVKQQCGALAIHKDSKDSGIRSLWTLIENNRMERLQELFAGFEIRVVIVDEKQNKGPLTVDEI